ncbi:ROK family protein [Nonomuraea dietziae]|uniref:Putative NBD/HSP70 family sugar kinase n=1 Tax=Nonomuraea dietziae TaxID=65515 RepID=A0A7W5UYE3_9ACTN|nr:ROK family protein [Nonomuraea dietziae]MBB3726972.1 putative NBD/HSP70 family sugar kinase [Nonomuraea dietziae]
MMSGPERRTVRDLRRGNRAIVLRALYFGGPASRQELTGATGLSAATVSNVTAGLLAEGAIVEAGLVESDGGRPRVLLRVDPEHGYAIGVDVGETHVRVELFDLAMTERAKADYALRPARHEAQLVARHILAGIDVVLAEAGVGRERMLGVGIGVPGIVEHGPAAVIHAQTFGWESVPLGTLLRAGTSLPLFVDNGAKTMGQAELWFGAGRGARHAIVALVGSGVGANIVTDGVTYRGVTGSAGEWGHTTVVVNGRRCRCGALGCLEAYVGAEGVLGRYAEAGGVITTDDEQVALAALLEDGSAAARQVVEETVSYLGAGLGNLVNLFNPERIVVGGWAGLLLGRRHLPALREAAGRHALAQPYRQTTIELGELGPDAVALGAATLVIESFLQ